MSSPAARVTGDLSVLVGVRVGVLPWQSLHLPASLVPAPASFLPAPLASDWAPPLLLDTLCGATCILGPSLALGGGWRLREVGDGARGRAREPLSRPRSAGHSLNVAGTMFPGKALTSPRVSFPGLWRGPAYHTSGEFRLVHSESHAVPGRITMASGRLRSGVPLLVPSTRSSPEERQRGTGRWAGKPADESALCRDSVPPPSWDRRQVEVGDLAHLSLSLVAR